MIGTDGNLLSKQWFDEIYGFKNGIAKVKLNKKYNFIDTNGKLVSQLWFNSYDEAYDYLMGLQ